MVHPGFWFSFSYDGTALIKVLEQSVPRLVFKMFISSWGKFWARNPTWPKIWLWFFHTDGIVQQHTLEILASSPCKTLGVLWVGNLGTLPNIVKKQNRNFNFWELVLKVAQYPWRGSNLCALLASVPGWFFLLKSAKCFLTFRTLPQTLACSLVLGSFSGQSTFCIFRHYKAGSVCYFQDLRAFPIDFHLLLSSLHWL